MGNFYGLIVERLLPKERFFVLVGIVYGFSWLLQAGFGHCSRDTFSAATLEFSPPVVGFVKDIG